MWVRACPRGEKLVSLISFGFGGKKGQGEWKSILIFLRISSLIPGCFGDSISYSNDECSKNGGRDGYPQML